VEVLVRELGEGVVEVLVRELGEGGKEIHLQVEEVQARQKL